ncbi:type I-E CRISPR-associated protein Cas6/Cse3/CasE [Yoonia sediminilitoris]|uniref:CRISPR system Cascade subunit CasE n=1 Tax=Yoonia sediminilitoris TaxID=1286148 RepID=A0A2T6K757_9RHOB|nr:type I-E CRISPR-associated protein Cas6/Cse3/CasE [Yoonia sediminilitoris]PUB10539.1 CRISPR system Cascade subunit CasE [Yoonia sediminilitoris]RCW90081.1 CRISPR system Cascade subunit CasE [Yoonia sediminilitoris]
MSMFISRVTVSRSPSVQAMNVLLLPDDAGKRTDAHHRLLWTLFADEPDRKRDFLWREERAGEFLILSAREPVSSELFSRVDTKPFDPVLAVGDRLDFALRANATRAKKSVGRVDVVMDALHGIAPDKRATKRMEIAQIEGPAWIERQGARNGFVVKRCEVKEYLVHVLPTYRGKRVGQPQFGILDLQGTVEVTDSEPFRTALEKGFGRAKAFGCGLMLIRRAV